MITFEDLSNLLNGASVDFDNFYGPQCVDLVQFWSRNLGGPRFTGDAQDIFNQAGSFYTQIVNTPDGVPQKGDIVVWSSTFNGTVGHVGIATGKGDTNTFEVFEQNDPGPGVCLFKTYDYNSVLGWLHPASIPQDQQAVIDQLRNERDANWNLYQKSQEDLQKCQSDLSSCQSSTQSSQVPEGTVTFTTDVPIQATTNLGSTVVNIPTNSTNATTSSSNSAIQGQAGVLNLQENKETLSNQSNLIKKITFLDWLKKIWTYIIG